MAAGTVGGVSTAGFASAAAGMAVQSTLSGALMYGAIQGATAGFVGGLLTSGGDVNYAFKSAMAGGITGGLTSFGNAGYGTVGRIAGQSLGAGINAQLNGSDFFSGLRYGASGAIQGWAFDYMKSGTDKWATAYWKGNMHTDGFGNLWTYGGRGCAAGGGGQCGSWLSWLGMKPEYSMNGDDTWNQKFLGTALRLGETPFVGEALNIVSKTHDWMNNALSGGNLYSAGGASNFGDNMFKKTAMDVVSFAGMLPAAKITAQALWQSPLQGR